MTALELLIWAFVLVALLGSTAIAIAARRA